MSEHGFAYLFERFPSFVQTFCYREAVEMARQGMNPLILSVRQPDDPPELAASLGVRVTYLPPEKELRAEIDRRLDARQPPGAVRRAIKQHRSERDSQRLFEAVWLAPVLREHGIRHVHAHFGGLATRTAWWLRKLFGIPYSFTGHANDIFCEADVPLKNAALVEDATLVVCETDFARRWMEQRHAAARGKTFRVFNGIDVHGFPERAPAGPVPLLLSVGRYVEKKGFGDLIEACRILRGRGISFTCQIVGEGPLASPLQQQIDRSSLGEIVTLAGPHSQTEVRRLLSEAAVFVLACVSETGGGSDNLPTVIVEAMAAAVPVVSTTVAGVPEMIESGKDGLLAPSHAPDQIAAEVETLLANPAQADDMGRRGRTNAQARFAVEKTTAELKHILARHAEILIPVDARRLDPDLPSHGRRPSLLTRLGRLLGAAS